MNCLQILKQLPYATITRLKQHPVLKHYCCDLDKLTVALTNISTLTLIYNLWKKTQQYIFETLIRKFGSCPFRWQDLKTIQWPYLVSEADLRLALLRFCESGALFAFKNKNTDTLYVVPMDAFYAWGQKWAIPPMQCPGHLDEAEFTELITAAMPAPHQFLKVMTWILKNQLRITRSGAYYKTDMTKAAEVLKISSELFQAWVKLGLHIDLLYFNDNTIVVHKQNCEDWALLGQAEAERQLQRSYMESSLHSSGWKQWLFLQLTNLKQGIWIPAAMLLTRFTQDVELVFFEWQQMGWIELGRKDKQLWVRRSTIFNGEPEMFVLPNFEVIVYPEPTLVQMWNLEHFACPKRGQENFTYTLTKESVLQAIQLGQNVAYIIQFMDSGSKYGLPDPVRQVLVRWDEGNAAVVQQTTKHSKTQTATVKKTLDLTPMEKLPLVEELYPCIDEVPKMWLEKLRAYHVSTKKQMVLQAIQWKTYLKIKDDAGEWDFIPSKLKETGNTWHVEGESSTGLLRLSAEQWKEMKLILPGINDTNNVSTFK